MSNKAKACPSCGAKVPKSVGVIGWLGIPRHPATQSTNIRPPIPRSSGRAVGAQRRRFALLV
ncbi:hypothetical protein [Pseudomonas aeruginosa]|uniref:hypothetical protein n=1 Tax=Pseudomonas aeruginosa TaxID=287 RepID=UPI003D07AF4B